MPHITSLNFPTFFRAVLAMFLCVGLAAVLPGVPVNAVEPTGSIAGTITWPNGTMDPRAFPYVYTVSETGPPSSQAIPAADGSYQIDGLTPGEYVVTFGEEKDMYSTQFFGGTNHETATKVTVISGAVTTVNFTATYTSSISGTITDPAAPGTPLQSQVFVRIVNELGVAGNFTDVAADGSYTIWNLGTGTYRVQVLDLSNYYLDEYFGEAFTLDAAEPVTVTNGEQHANVNVELNLSAVMTGQFVNAQGAPITSSVEGMVVTAYDETGTNVGGVRSNTDGTFSLGELPTGRYRFAFSSSSCGYETRYFPAAEQFVTTETMMITRGQPIDIGPVEMVTHTRGCAPIEVSHPSVTMNQGTVHASWNPADVQGGPEVSQYQVSSIPSGASCTTTGATTCVVTGMVPAVTYRLFVFAVNTGGQSLPGLPSDPFHIAAPPTVPQSEAVTKKQKVAHVSTTTVGRVKKLPKRSNAGVRVTWVSLTPRNCGVREGKLVARKVGTCRLRVNAPANGAWARHSSVTVVRIHRVRR